MGVRPEPTHVARRPGDVRHSRADLRAAERDLGHCPVVNFREGLEKTVAWFSVRT
jgi:UDP-glucose 4-epimerase